ADLWLSALLWPAGPADPHGAHRLVLASAAGAGDAAGGYRTVRTTAFQRPAHHRPHCLLANGAGVIGSLQQVRGHLQQLLLDAVGIGDEAALEPVGAAGHRGDG